MDKPCQRLFRLGARSARLTGVAEFLCGYMVAWVPFGSALIAADRLVDGSPTTAKWVGASIFLLAGVYQLTPLEGGMPAALQIPIR